MEAAEALFPADAAEGWSQDNPRGWFSRLSVDLLRALFARRDLYLTGRNLALPIDAPRVPVGRDLYAAGNLFVLSIMDETLRIDRPGGGRTSLQAVRVQAVRAVRPPPDFPTEAAHALPLDRALVELTDPLLAKKWQDVKKRLAREGRWEYDPDYPRDRTRDRLSEFDGHGHRLREETSLLWSQIKDEFTGRMAQGFLTTWGRDGSPFAVPLEIPASAWRVLAIADAKAGTVRGAHGTLFDVHIGPRFVMPRVVEPMAAAVQKERAGAPDLPRSEINTAAAPKVPNGAPSPAPVSPIQPDAIPPAAGWTLREAVALLCPRELAVVERGGEELRVWLHDRMDGWDGLLPTVHGAEEATWYAWSHLFEVFLSAVRQRPALTFTGYDRAAPIEAPPTKVPRERLDDPTLSVRLTGSEDDIGQSIVFGRVTIEFGQSKTTLTGVRIVDAGSVRHDGLEPPPQPAPKPRGAVPGEHPANDRRRRLSMVRAAMTLVEAGNHSVRAALLAVVKVPPTRKPDDVIRPYREDMRRNHKAWYDRYGQGKGDM